MKIDTLSTRSTRPTHALYPRVRFLLVAGCVMLGLVTLVSIFFYSRMFTIEFVDVDTVGGIDQNAARALVFQQMERMRFGIFPQRNLLLFSKQELEKELSKRFVIRSLSITKRLPKKLVISLTGEPFRLLHLFNGKILDRAPDGSVTADVTEHRADEGVSMRIARLISSGQQRTATEIPDVPIVRGGEQLNGEAIMFIRSVFSSSHARGYQPMYFEVDSNALTVTMHTREGWRILLTSFSDPVTQLSLVATILEKHFKNSRSALQYIDVRFDNRVYYK